jgi:hypothetical protein
VRRTGTSDPAALDRLGEPIDRFLDGAPQVAAEDAIWTARDTGVPVVFPRRPSRSKLRAAPDMRKPPEWGL